MKLRFSPTSPYVRKVMVCAIELGLADDIELLPTNVWDPGTDIAETNPLGKVPALILADHSILYDSPVISEYLDHLKGGNAILPAPGPARWQALRRQALADGILDAAVLRLLEQRRDEAQQSEAWIQRQSLAVLRALDQLEGEADQLGNAVNVGTIAIGVALGYLDFRFPDDNWRAEHPALADWNDSFATRASMMQTEPKDP